MFFNQPRSTSPPNKCTRFFVLVAISTRAIFSRIFTKLQCRFVALSQQFGRFVDGSREQVNGTLGLDRGMLALAQKEQE